MSNLRPLSATSARVAIENIYDVGWGNIDFTLNWTNPVYTTSVVAMNQIPGSDGGQMSSTYAGLGYKVAVRPHASAPTGTFCNGVYTLNMQLGLFNPATNQILGWYNDVYRVTMAR